MIVEATLRIARSRHEALSSSAVVSANAMGVIAPVA
jgi:hypothetical protein